MIRNCEKKTYDNDFAINCDWLQIHCKHSLKTLLEGNIKYQFLEDGQSKVFRKIYKITNILTGMPIGNYCTDASDCILPKTEGILKFENSNLYIHEDLQSFIKEFLAEINFKFISVTRLDIAFDFQCFAGGFTPRNLIDSYLKNKIVLAKGGKVNFGVYGNQEKGIMNFESLTIGSKSSNIITRLYNKTNELQNNCKPWITNVHDQTFDNNIKVWRLEFSITSMNAFLRADEAVKEKAYELRKKDNKLSYQKAITAAIKILGIQNDITSLDVLRTDKLYGIFIGLFKKHFYFKRYEKKQRVTRMKTINLWKFDFEHLRIDSIIKSPMLKHSSRAEKIFINKLDQFNQDFRLFDENFSYTAKELLGKIIEMHDLHEYAKQKNIEYIKPPNYIENVNEWAKIKPSHSNLENEFITANQAREQYERRLNY